MGSYAIMRFFDETFDLQTDTIPDFIRTGLNLLLLGPFRLIQEISKKVVYLKKKSVEQMLFLSIFIGFGFTIVFSLIKIKTGVFSLWTGTLPLIIMLVGSLLLVVIYLCIASVQDTVDFSVFSTKRAVHTEEKDKVAEDIQVSASNKVVSDAIIDDDFMDDFPEDQILHDIVIPKNEEIESKVEKIQSIQDSNIRQKTNQHMDEEITSSVTNILSSSVDKNKLDETLNAIRSVIYQYDNYVPPKNPEILDSTKIRNYQNKLQHDVSSLQEYQQQCEIFSQEEVDLLQRKLDATTPPSKYLSREFIENFDLNALSDEELALTTSVDDIPEDFTLCS